MTLDEVSKDANEAVAQMCTTFMEGSRGPQEYESLVAAAASTLLFHVFRTGLLKSEAHAMALLRAVLGDTSCNLQRLGGHSVQFRVNDTES